MVIFGVVWVVVGIFGLLLMASRRSASDAGDAIVAFSSVVAVVFGIVFIYAGGKYSHEQAATERAASVNLAHYENDKDGKPKIVYSSANIQFVITGKKE
jgi:uncharacterized membrane protein